MSRSSIDNHDSVVREISSTRSTHGRQAQNLCSSCPCQKTFNHRGTYVRYQEGFTRFYTTQSLDMWCMGLDILATSLRHSQLQSRPSKSQLVVVTKLLEKKLMLGLGGSKSSNAIPRGSIWLLSHGKREGQAHTYLHGSWEDPPHRRKKIVQGR